MVLNNAFEKTIIPPFARVDVLLKEYRLLWLLPTDATVMSHAGLLVCVISMRAA